MVTSRTLLLAAFAIATLLTSPNFLHAQDAVETRSTPKDEVETPTLQSRMLGVWLLAGKPGTTDKPAPGARMRFFGDHHWLITQADTDTGVVIFHHGGTYTLEGDVLTEKTTFATEPTARMIGQENKFKVSVHNGTYTQIGIGNPWSEDWRRASTQDGEYQCRAPERRSQAFLKWLISRRRPVTDSVRRPKSKQPHRI